MTTRAILSTLVKSLLTVVVLYFLSRQVMEYWEELRNYSWQLNWLFILGSILLSGGGPIIFAQSWRGIIGSFSHRVSLPEAFKITYLSNLGRYLPGKVWQFVGVVYLSSKKQIPPESAGASMVLIQFFSVPSALLVYLLCAQFDPAIGVDHIGFMGQYSALLLTLGGVGLGSLMIFYPRPLIFLANRLLAWLGRDPIDFQIDKVVALKVFGGYFLGWIVYGLSFWLLLMAVDSARAPSLIAAVGIFCIAYQIGYLALFAPGGLGVRELVMITLLTPYFGPLAAAVALLARLWSVVIDTLPALAAMRIKLE